MKNRNKQLLLPFTKEELSIKEALLLFLEEDEYVRNRIYNIRHGETETTGDVKDAECLKQGEKDRIKEEI
jgi:hypothetical protein